MRIFLLLIAVFSELSSAFIPEPHFFSSRGINKNKNEGKLHGELSLSSPKSAKNDADLASVVNKSTASSAVSNTATLITGANGVLGQSLIWYRTHFEPVQFR